MTDMLKPTCPICHKPLPAAVHEAKQAPFCSRRCREIDFFRWAEGRYAIAEPLRPREDDDSAPAWDVDEEE